VTCQPAVARAEILSQGTLKPLVPIVRHGGGVDRVICADIDDDGVRDLAFSVASGGTAGDLDWVVMLRAGNRWRVVKFGHGYKLGLVRRGADLVVTQPDYRKNDPNCCPSGGFDHVAWRWDGDRLAAARRWHDRSPSP
jgi:hypothetical protein